MYLPKFKFLKDVAKPGAFSLPGEEALPVVLLKTF